MDGLGGSVSRRKILVGAAGGAGVLAAVAAPAVNLRLMQAQQAAQSAPSLWTRIFFSLKNGSYGDWSGLVGSVFRLTSEKGPTELKLIEVKPFESSGARPASLGRSTAFTAVFETAGAPPEGDRTYTASHQRYGILQIYMSPSVAAGPKTRLHAVFN